MVRSSVVGYMHWPIYNWTGNADLTCCGWLKPAKRHVTCDVITYVSPPVTRTRSDSSNRKFCPSYTAASLVTLFLFMIFVVVDQSLPWRRHACIFIILTLLQSWPHPWHIKQPRLMYRQKYGRREFPTGAPTSHKGHFRGTVHLLGGGGDLIY